MKVLVTGGSGFLGKRIVQELLENPDLIAPKTVTVFDVKDFDGKPDQRIRFIKGDISDRQAVDSVCRNQDYVIHAASIVDWGNQSDAQVKAINVGGTENVIQACRSSGVKGLIYTSSLDVMFSGEPQVEINENTPYPERYMTMYCESKFLAEKAALEANSAQLKTCALRPSDIWGEDDPYHIDSLIEVAASGFYVRLGDGTAKCQHVYVGNCAYAHVLAVKAMADENALINGQAYLLTDGPGSNFFKFFDPILMEAGVTLKPKNLWLPRPAAMTMATVSEGIAFLARPFKKYNPKFSRFAVTYTTTDFTFNSRKAEDHFGFQPKYSHSEAVKRTVAFYRSKVAG